MAQLEETAPKTGRKRLAGWTRHNSICNLGLGIGRHPRQKRRRRPRCCICGRTEQRVQFTFLQFFLISHRQIPILRAARQVPYLARVSPWQ